MVRSLEFLWHWNFMCSWSDCDNGLSARWLPKFRGNKKLPSSVDHEETWLFQHFIHGDSRPIMICLIGAQQNQISEGNRRCYTPKNTWSYQTYGTPQGWTKYSYASPTTGIRSEKCVIRRFRRRANVIERTYTNRNSIAYYTPSPYIASCSFGYNLYSMLLYYCTEYCRQL